MFTLSWTNVKSAIIYAVLMALVSMGIYVIGVGNIFALDTHVLINSGVLAIVTAFVSLVKNFFTDNSGNFAGIVQVVQPTIPSLSPLNSTTVS